MSRPGRLVVISGPSGVGKSTLIAEAHCGTPKCRLAVSATTRPPRPGEKDGVHYHFVTPDAFAAMRDGGELLEYARRARRPLRDSEGRGRCRGSTEGWTVILDVDTQGFRAVRQGHARDGGLRDAAVDRDPRREAQGPRRPRTTRRSRAGSTNAHAEIACAGEYDHRVVNDDVDARLNEKSDSTVAADRTELRNT